VDTARQVLRFSIPGSITLLLIAGFLVLGRLLQGESWDAVGQSVAENVSAVVAIVAAIPIGFLIYQIYYATYRAVVWPWRPRPFKSEERWVRIDRGRQILALLPLDQQARIAKLFDVELKLDSILDPELSWLGKRAHAYRLKEEFLAHAGPNYLQQYRDRWQENWNIVRALVDLSDSTDVGGAIRSEYMTLSDIYHALGACRAGVQLAWLVSTTACIAYIIDGQSFWGSALTMVLTLVTTLILFWVCHRARGHTWVSAQESLKFGLTALFKRRPDLLEDRSAVAT
jgi:hypothetical protein